MSAPRDPCVPVETLHTMYRYDPSTGHLESLRYPGKKIRYVSADGYVQLRIKGKQVGAHRVAWAMHHGEWPGPEYVIDHINGVRSDNRIENLRKVSPAENQRNYQRGRIHPPRPRTRRKWAVPRGTLPCVVELRLAFQYDAASGKVTCRKTGDAVGTVTPRGYLRALVNGKQTALHRLAWALHYGEWPNAILDHIDGNPFNNRIENLRPVSAQQNMANKRSAQGSSSSYKGVVRRERFGKVLWEASIGYNHRMIYLGRYHTEEQAAQAYNQKAASLFGGHARLNRVI